MAGVIQVTDEAKTAARSSLEVEGVASLRVGSDGASNLDVERPVSKYINHV